MSKAVLCPVCSGKGILITESKSNPTMSAQNTCHGCNGKGWVEVGDNVPHYPQLPWYLPVHTWSGTGTGTGGPPAFTNYYSGV